MYVVEDELFKRTRAVLSALAKAIADRPASGGSRPVDLPGLVRESSPVDLPEGGEADYVVAIAAELERMFPIEELFPRKRRAERA